MAPEEKPVLDAASLTCCPIRKRRSARLGATRHSKPRGPIRAQSQSLAAAEAAGPFDPQMRDFPNWGHISLSALPRSYDRHQ